MSDVIFTVANTGTGVTSGPLYLGPDAVSLGGDAAADYRVVTQPDEEVVAGASTTFVIRFDPTVAGAAAGHGDAERDQRSELQAIGAV